MTVNRERIHILVVDDDVLIREAFAASLAAEGFAVSTAEDGVAALMALAEEPVDLVVTDLRMPRLDGYTLISHLRRLAPSLPVLAITGDLPSRELRRLSDGQGERVVVLSKPVLFQRFLQSVRALLGIGMNGGRQAGSCEDLQAMR